MKKTKKGRTTPKPRKAQAQKKTAPQQISAGRARAEGLRLYKVAGKPTREQVILVYGERGPVMTWAERAKAGVPAKRFQTALAAKRVSVGKDRPWRVTPISVQWKNL